MPELTRERLGALRVQAKELLAADRREVLVCAGTGCVAGGSLDIYARLKELIDEKGLYCQVELDHEHHSHGHDGCDSSNVKTVGLKKSGCHGFCEMGPLVRMATFTPR